MTVNFVRIGQFHVRPGRVTAFRAASGPEGDCARLFRQVRGYHGTELLESAMDPATYLTIDRWKTAADWEVSPRRWRVEYAAPDQACGQLAAGEHEVGTFGRPAV
jgi:heme-degrading monooxygenase HmoA